MRNLKRALSLVMATAMLLGMMVIGAGAVSIDDFADKDDIVNKEAVALMVDLGIIEGKSPTSYDPKGTLERAAVAKLIYYVKMGQADESPYKGLNTGLNDVNGKTWAEGFINYCVGAGIIDGVGGGRFNPTGKLTVAATAKVLLVALGYDADNRGYTGNTYAISVMRDAQINHLLDGIDQGANEAITRDNAARMFYNALFASTKLPNYQYDMGNRYVTDYDDGPSLGTISYGLERVPAVVTSINANGKGVLNVASGYTLTGLNAAQILLPASPDLVGSTVNLYVKGTSSTSGATTTVVGTKLYTSTLISSGNNVVTTISDDTYGTGTGALTTMVNKNLITMDASPSYFYNGVTATTANQARIGVIGVTVDLKDKDGDGDVDNVVITEKTVKKLNSAPVVTTTNGVTYVSIADAAVSNVRAENVIGYEGLAKGDVILYVTVGGVTYIEKAEKITGTVTGNHALYGALINGEYYIASQLQGLAGAAYTDNSIRDVLERDFWLDEYGNIVHSAVVSGAVATTNYAIVDRVSWVTTTGNGTGDLGATSSKYLQARLVFPDGTSELAAVASVNGFIPVAAGGKITDLVAGTNDQSFATGNSLSAINSASTSTALDNTTNTTADNYYVIYKDAAGTISATSQVMGRFYAVNDHAGDALTALVPNGGVFYQYSVNARGQYVLTSTLKTGDTADQLANDKIYKGQARFNNSLGTSGLTGNANTVFIYETPNGDGTVSYTTYTGIANVPTTASAVTNSGVAGAVIKNAQGYATYVYVKTTGAATNTADVVYVLSPIYTLVNATVPYYIYSAVVNGTVTTVKSDAQVGVGFYTVSAKTADEICTLSNTINSSAVTGIMGNAGGVLVVDNSGTASSYKYEANTPAYYISGMTSTPTTVAALSLDATDTVLVMDYGTGEATVVYVVDVSARPSGLTVAASDGSLADATGTASTNVYAGLTGTGIKTKTLTVTAAATAGMSYTLSVKGNGASATAATGSSASVGAAAAASAYTVESDDTAVSVVVTATDSYTGAVYIYTYTITVAS